MVIARSLRGMNDLYESDLRVFRKLENTLQTVCHAFGYHEIRTPILEEIALFKRGIGESTDIVEKEMFVVQDGDSAYVLRPENTAAVVRALIERGGIGEDTLEKLFYFGPMFRKERPQKGRLRQFHQFGVELFGVSEPTADVEVLVLVDQFLKSLNISGISLTINSLGANDERVAYKSILQQFLSNHADQFCEDCKRRIVTNPLRVLDCKNPVCRAITEKAPRILQSLGTESREHFDAVQQGLSDQGVSFDISETLVRGLDYYNRTVFEFIAQDGLGAQNTVVGGGRYDGLFHTLGSKIDLPSIGAAGGVERLIMLLQNSVDDASNTIAVALIGADDAGMRYAQDCAFKLRRLGIAADFSLAKKSTKAQMRRADRIGAQRVAVIGEQEISSKRFKLKTLANGESRELDLDISVMANFINSESQ